MVSRIIAAHLQKAWPPVYMAQQHHMSQHLLCAKLQACPSPVPGRQSVPGQLPPGRAVSVTAETIIPDAWTCESMQPPQRSHDCLQSMCMQCLVSGRW